MKRRRPDPARPLADPNRAPYARRALARKQREAERQALEALAADPEKHRKVLANIDALQQLLGDA